MNIFGRRNLMPTVNVNIQPIGFHSTGDNITTLESDAAMYGVTDSDSLTINL